MPFHAVPKAGSKKYRLATSLPAAGGPPSEIQAIGQWKSDSFECYIRRHSTLLQAVLFHGQSIHDLPLLMYYSHNFPSPLFPSTTLSGHGRLIVHTPSPSISRLVVFILIILFPVAAKLSYFVKVATKAQSYLSYLSLSTMVVCSTADPSLSSFKAICKSTLATH